MYKTISKKSSLFLNKSLLKNNGFVNDNHISLFSLTVNDSLSCDYINDYLLTNCFGVASQKVKSLTHRPRLLKTANKIIRSNLFNKQTELINKKFCDKHNDFVNKSFYNSVVIVHTNNEIHIRLNPYFNSKNKDTDEDKQNKFLANCFDNNQPINEGSRCLLFAEEDTKKVVDKQIVKEDKEYKEWSILETPKPTIFTKDKARKVVRSVSALELIFGATNGLILTVTLPGSTDGAKRAWAKETGNFSNHLRKFARQRIGNDANYMVGVWEFQKRGALHTHAVVYSHDREGLQKIKDDFHQYCYQAMLNIDKKYAVFGVSLFDKWDGTTWKNNPEKCQFDAQFIEKSAAAYIGKYISKEETKIVNSILNKDTFYYPTRWVNLGSGCNKLLNSLTIKSESKILTKEDVEDLILMSYEVADQFSEGKYKDILVYKDKIGDAINIRIIVKPENRLEAGSILIDYINYLKRIKTNHLNSHLPSYKDVLEIQDNIDYMYAMNQIIGEKYGNRDPRLWLKNFRSNKAPLPSFTTDEQWENYYKNDNRYDLDYVQFNLDKISL